MKETLKRILSAVLDIPENEIADDISIENTDKWDSLNHLKIILAMEDEFSIAFDDTEVMEVISLEKIVAALKSKGIE